MKEQIQKKLNDSKVLRWSVLALVAFTMLYILLVFAFWGLFIY